MNDWTPNFQNKPLAEFKPGESVYAARDISGFTKFFGGTLVEVNRGAVRLRGKWLPSFRGDRVPPEEVEETFRVDKCFVWGKGPKDHHDRCHWFNQGKHRPPS